MIDNNTGDEQMNNSLRSRLDAFVSGDTISMIDTAPAFSFAISDGTVSRKDFIDSEETSLRLIVSYPKTTLPKTVLDDLRIDYFKKVSAENSDVDIFRVSTGSRSVRSVLPIIRRDLESNRGLFYEIGSIVERLHTRLDGLLVTITLDSFGFDTSHVYLVPPYGADSATSLDKIIEHMSEQILEDTDDPETANRIEQFIRCGAGLIAEEQLAE